MVELAPFLRCVHHGLLDDQPATGADDFATVLVAVEVPAPALGALGYLLLPEFALFGHVLRGNGAFMVYKSFENYILSRPGSRKVFSIFY